MKIESNATQMVFCDIHGAQKFVFVSPNIAQATKSKNILHESEILLLNIESSNQTFKYYVDSQFLEEFVTLDEGREFYLKDRDKDKKEMNDRLIIQKIMKRLFAVCPICMESLLEPT